MAVLSRQPAVVGVGRPAGPGGGTAGAGSRLSGAL